MELTKLDIKEQILNVFKEEWIQITLLTMIAISAPLLIKTPQILVGSIVNLVLVFSVLKFGFKKTFPIAILPSLVAYSNNILFGGATYFLIYFLPVIILGNSVFILLTKNLKLKGLNIIIAGLCKSVVLFLFAYIFVNHFHLPRLFISSMGYVQLLTSAIGGYLGFILYKANS